MGKSDKAVSVFDKYAHEYDLMTNADQRVAYHKKEVQAVVKKFSPEKVLDAGCATGLTAWLFAEEGIEAVGLDRSRKMIEQAKKKFAKKKKLPLSFRQGSFEKLPANMKGKFDLVVCLANSISGLDNITNLRLAMKNFHDVLKPGGNLVVQALNYSAVTEDVLLPVKATENKGIVYARYARRQGKRYGLHVIRLDLNKKPIKFEPFCHEFDNFSHTEVKDCMVWAGFESIGSYADLYCAKKFVRSGRDLVMTGKKPV